MESELRAVGAESRTASRPTSKSTSRSRARSKASDRSVRPTRATAKARSKSRAGAKSTATAAGGGARSTTDLNSKQRGELAEMMFMVKVARKGFATAKPYGDSRRYDFVLDVGTRLWRVQVKSSSAEQYGSYLVNLQRNANGEAVPYDPSEIDFVVAYVTPCDAWFVIPVEAIAGQQSAKMCLRGNPRSGKMGKYWEAWGLMTWRWAENG
jgi:hypothetical protein